MILRENNFKTELQKTLDHASEQPPAEEQPFQDVTTETRDSTPPQWLFREPEGSKDKRLF